MRFDPEPDPDVIRGIQRVTGERLQPGADPFDPAGWEAPSSWPQYDPKVNGPEGRDRGRCVIPRMIAGGWEPCPRRANSVHHRNHHHTDNRPSNKLSVCGDGTSGHHGYIEAHPEEARLFRWSVTRHEPGNEPVWLWHPVYGLGWYLLTDSYGLDSCPPPRTDPG
jgi:hypothetical protein